MYEDCFARYRWGVKENGQVDPRSYCCRGNAVSQSRGGFSPMKFIEKLVRFYRQALKLETKTRFTCIEIEGLLRIFDKLVEKYNSPMTKTVLKDVLFNFFGLTNDIMMDKIFRTMANGKSTMTYEDWIIGMDIYLRGTLKQLANFAFTVYDHQRRDFLSKEDIQMYLKNILAANIPDEDAEECQTDMLDMVFLLLDQDKDGY
ncbi:hypothetical protein X801_09444, partial [Opisthorchis viverrini]